MRDFPASHSLRAEYEPESARWLLDFMARMNVYGSLRKVLLRNRENKIIGWYVYCVRPGGVGEVVQVGTAHSSVAVVLDHLFYDAWSHGAIALHGRLDSRLSEESLGRHCFYFPGNRLLVHSRDPELTRQIQNGSAFLTRLDCAWCLRVGRHGTTARRCNWTPVGHNKHRPGFAADEDEFEIEWFRVCRALAAWPCRGTQCRIQITAVNTRGQESVRPGWT